MHHAGEGSRKRQLPDLAQPSRPETVAHEFHGLVVHESRRCHPPRPSADDLIACRRHIWKQRAPLTGGERGRFATLRIAASHQQCLQGGAFGYGEANGLPGHTVGIRADRHGHAPCLIGEALAHDGASIGQPCV